MALTYLRPNPPLIGDGTVRWTLPVVGTHYTTIDEPWEAQNTADFVSQSNTQAADEYILPAGFVAETQGTITDFRYYILVSSVGIGQTPSLALKLFVGGAQQGSTKEVQLPNYVVQEKMIKWDDISIDCQDWYTGPRTIWVSFLPTGGDTKPPPDEPVFEI